MSSEVHQCQNCTQEFLIEPEDFEFYKKIEVSPPTWCSRCRLERRLSFYNLTNLFKRPCDLCKKEVVSVYPPDALYTVYCPTCWWSDKWNPQQYEREFDPSRPFFKQLNELIHQMPLVSLSIDPASRDHSPYNNHVTDVKNCYLTFQAASCEDCAYGFDIIFSRQLLNCSLIHSCERLYDSIGCYKDSNCIGLRGQVTETINSSFLSYSKNCQDCFASRNLRNKKYVAFNQQYSKEEYKKIVSQYDLGSWRTYQEVKRLADDHMKQFSPDPDISERSVGCMGRRLFDSKNCKECYEAVGVQDSKFMTMISSGPVSDSYDVTCWGVNIDQCYECMNCGHGTSRSRFLFDSGLQLSDAEYSFGSIYSSHIFGSVFLNKKQYAILNKSYNKESFEKLRREIVQHMNDYPYIDMLGREYRYGEFFPSELSPFPYNLTLAHLFFPYTKEEAIKKGYAWYDWPEKEKSHTLAAENIPDHIKDVKAEIVKEIIGCLECGRGFRILESELSTCRSMNVPLPRTCPFCRIKEKMTEWVRSLRMLDRTCAKCRAVFQTNYDEEEAPYILCKSCYQAEVV